MKKLLVLAMVLSMASMANAALTLTVGGSVDEGAATSFDITNPGGTIGDMGVYYVTVDNSSTGTGSFDIGAVTQVYMGGGTNIGIDDSSDDLGALNAMAAIAMGITDNVNNPQLVPTGNIFTGVKLNGLTAGDVVVKVFDGALNEIGSYDVTVTSIVPEPMTIGLLGLGALALRRRK